MDFPLYFQILRGSVPGIFFPAKKLIIFPNGLFHPTKQLWIGEKVIFLHHIFIGGAY